MQIVKRSATALFLAVLSFSAVAHPHSFITLKTQIMVKDEQVTGLKMRWVMDELTSADLLYDAGNAKPGEKSGKSWRRRSWPTCSASTTLPSSGITGRR